ncbi:MAG: zinc ribbon domain-containing protein [Erysipelotrichaceae bacterium]|nr:zinc ribbon domain-containing protein [Erysipelotrichaceae bacterium]
MKRCPGCGKIYDDNKTFCGACGRRLEEYAEQTAEEKPSGVTVNKETVTQYLNQGKTKVESFTKATGESLGAIADGFKNAFPDRGHDCFVVLTEDEQVIKEYQVSTVLFPPMKGYLMVTNKRLILYGSAFWSKIYQETPIDSVGSLEAFYGFRFHFIPLIFGLLLLIAYPYAKRYVYWIAYEMDSPFIIGRVNLMWIIGLIMVVLSIHRSIIITVKSTKAIGAGIQYGSMLTKGFTSVLFQGRAGRDADLMMSEIGAIVLDLQQKGVPVDEE